MPRTKEQFEAMRKATEEKIQSAAIKLFARKGYAATGVQDIADEATISIGLLYRHYKTKEELFNELVDQAVKGLNDLNNLMQSELSPKVIIDQIINEIYTDMTENEDFANMLVLMTQAAFTDTAIMNKVIEADGKMFYYAAAAIEKGQKMGLFRLGDSKKMASLLFSQIQGIGMMKTVLGKDFTMPEPEQMTAFIYLEKTE